MEWSGMGEMEGEGERNGRMGDWRGSGMGGEGFQAKRDGHRAPRGGWPVWLEIPIYIKEPSKSLYFWYIFRYKNGDCIESAYYAVSGPSAEPPIAAILS